MRGGRADPGATVPVRKALFDAAHERPPAMADSGGSMSGGDVAAATLPPARVKLAAGVRPRLCALLPGPSWPANTPYACRTVGERA